MRLPAELCKMQRKKRETDGFSKKYMDDPARFASDFRVRSPARSAKVF